MKIGDGVEALEIPMDFPGAGGGTINPVVLWSDADGATLIDAGLPGQLGVFEEKLAAAGLKASSLRRILLTHQDPDHIGAASALSGVSRAEVYAHTDDVPFIQGEMPLLKLDMKRMESRLATLPADGRARALKLLASPPKVRVDHVLQGGEELPWYGGITVIPTPGHTPGHVCLYLKAQGLLLAGDALRVENGSLIGPSPMATAA
jgi:glyoxylase-like metal-dependent hydrolase (beta-lactamase superfamily II)